MSVRDESGSGGIVIGNPVITGTVHSSLFIDASGNLAQDANLTYNSSTNVFTYSVDEFVLQPNSSAAVPTMIVRTLFDSADSVVARFTGPDRATAANFDRASIEFYLDDSNEAQAQFAELEFVAQTASAGGRYGGLFFYTQVNGSSINMFAVGQSSAGGVGYLVNNSRIDSNSQFNTVTNNGGTLFLDAGLDAVELNLGTTRASSAGQTWNGFNVKASTCTVTGSTSITTATGFNLINISAPTISAASALTVTNASTVYISGAPIQAGGGPATITNTYALWVDGGTTRLDGTLAVESSFACNGVTPTSRRTFTITNDIDDVAYDADTVTTAELADVVATLIAALANTGLVSKA